MVREPVIRMLQIPEAFADLGYSTKEYADHVITVCYKDEEIAALNQATATPNDIINIIARHFVRMAMPAGVAE